MKKGMYFFMGLSFTLFWVELYLASTNQGHWGFVWINVLIFFVATVGLAQAYYEEREEAKKSKKDKSKVMDSKQKYIWGDSRCYKDINKDSCSF